MQLIGFFISLRLFTIPKTCMQRNLGEMQVKLITKKPKFEWHYCFIVDSAASKEVSWSLAGATPFSLEEDVGF